MTGTAIGIAIVVVVALLVAAMAIRVVNQYERGVLFRLVDKNTTAVFPAPLASAIGDAGALLTRETAAAAAIIEPNLPRVAHAPAFTVTNGIADR